MAEDNLIFNLKVNTDQAVSGINSAASAIERYNDELLQVNKDTNELKETNILFKEELLKLDETYKKIPKSAFSARKKIKDQMDGLKTAIKENNLALEGFRLKKSQVASMKADFIDLTTQADHFEEALEVGEAGLGGYEAFIGLTAMAGVENENLLKSLHSLEAAEAALSGVQKVRESISKDGIIREKISHAQLKLRVLATKSQVSAQKLLNKTTGRSIKVTKGFGKALIATGIGAIVALLGLLISNFDAISKSMGKFIDSVPFLKSVKNTFNEIAESIGSVGNLLSSVGSAISAFFSGEDVSEAFSGALENGKKLIEAEEKLSEVTGENANNRERQIRLLEAQGGKEEEIAKLKKQQSIDEIKALERILELNGDVTEEQLDRLDELRTNLEVMRIEEEKAAVEAEKSKEEKLKAEREKAAEERRKKREEEAKLKAEEQKILEDLEVANIEDVNLRRLTQLEVSNRRELEELREKFGEESKVIEEAKKKQAIEVANLTKEIADAEKAAKDEIEAKQLEDAKLKEEAENNARKLNLETKLINARDDFDAEISVKQELIDLEREMLLANTDITNEELLNRQAQLNQQEEELDQQRLDKKIENEKKLNEAKMFALQSTLNAVSEAGNLMIKDEQKREAFQKKIALVQLGIDTAKSISSTIAGATQAAAAGGPAAPFLLAGYITSGLATIFASFSQAKKLLGATGSTQAPTLGGGSVGTGVSASDISQNIGAGAGDLSGTNVEDIISKDSGDTGAIRVAVLESDITDTQNRISQVEALSTI